jgi:hypothetical protein
VRHSTDLLVIGAGPTGLFSAYYAGFRGLSVAVADSLPELGGQITAMYPEKAILDVAGFPRIKGRDLVAGLVEQAASAKPTYLLGRTAVTLEQADESVTVGFDDGSVVVAMRIALLSYRSKPHCGGQGIYVRHLSRELVASATRSRCSPASRTPSSTRGVVSLTKVPSLDLYREPDPFRVPKLREFRDRIDVEEFADHVHGRLPEPRTFASASQAAAERARRLRRRPRQPGARLRHARGRGAGLPMVTTIHHPITFDRRIDLAATEEPGARSSRLRAGTASSDAGQGRPRSPQDPDPSESS